MYDRSTRCVSKAGRRGGSQGANFQLFSLSKVNSILIILCFEFARMRFKILWHVIAIAIE